MNILNEAVSLGIIDLAYLQEQIAMKNHPFKIWQGKNGYWYTYIIDIRKGRRLVKRKTKEDVEKAIAEANKRDKITFMSVYYEWREYKDTMVDENSVAKYDTDEKRYFSGREFFEKQITSYIEYDLMAYIRSRIDEDALCKSACKSFIGYLRNVFYYALRRGYIKESPMAFIAAKDFYKYCYASKRSKKSQVIDSDDLTRLDEIFEADYVKQPSYMPTYAVELASLTGMRVGEIAALRWDHVFSDHILIDISEKYKRKSKTFAIEATKNEKIREFPVTEEIRSLLCRIRENTPESEWVFANSDGSRIHAHVISSCLKNKCKMLGITERGIHAYRKTLNSTMRSNGVPSAIAASLIGNSVQVNDTYYTYDVASLSEKNRIVTKVNKDMKKSFSNQE